MKALSITEYTATTALGRGRAAQFDALRNSHSGLSAAPFETCTLKTWTGVVPGLDTAVSTALKNWDCRNNRLAELALHQDGFFEAALKLREKYGASRVGVFIGTSTSGIHQTERAYLQRDRTRNALPDWFHFVETQNTFSCADFVRLALGLEGVAMTVSTACSSSAKVFASAARAMASGQCDAAVVGGVDSLCLTTLHGFGSLQVLSSEICRPADAQRNGISIGEAAGYAILEKSGAGPALLGYGESSDAHHMSSPEPEGRGAYASMQAALQRAGLMAQQIDYINLHGTGTPANDAAEDKAVCALFGTHTPCSSTKGWTGHTLGAAGIVEAVIGLLCIEQGFMPGSLNTQTKDPLLQGNILRHNRQQKVARVLSNSFGFGGSNASLVFGAAG